MGFKFKRLRKQFKGAEKLLRPVIKGAQKILEPVVESVPVIGGFYKGGKAILQPILKEKRAATTAARIERHRLLREQGIPMEERLDAAFLPEIVGPVPGRRSRSRLFAEEGARFGGGMMGGIVSPSEGRRMAMMSRRGIFNPMTGRQIEADSQVPDLAQFLNLRRRLSPEPVASRSAPPSRRTYSSGRFFK